MPPTINTSRKSPNHSSRIGYPVRLALFHATVGGLASSLSWLCSTASRVSAHYVISKTGVIYQLVAETEAAWHAGDASWQGETTVNEISIGIELENLTGKTGFKGQDPYPDAQVQKAIDLSRNLMNRYPGIAFARHLDVALPKGRKTDPKGFDWNAFRARVSAPLTQSYRAITCAPVFQDRRPDVPLVLTCEAGVVEPMDDLTNGWLHLASGAGFSPLSCWVLV